jgi:hypothetical protein
MYQVKKLLDEDKRYANEKHGIFDSHREESAETPRIRVDSENIEQDGFSTMQSESSDASSMGYSYTVRSIASFNERTNWPFWPRDGEIRVR